MSMLFKKLHICPSVSQQMHVLHKAALRHLKRCKRIFSDVSSQLFLKNLSTCVKLPYFNIRFKVASRIYIYFSASLIYKVCQINMPYLSINHAGRLIKSL